MAQCLLLPPPPLQADQEGSLRRSQTPATLLEERTCLLTLSGPDPRSLVRLWGSGPSKTCCLTPGIGASPPALKCLHDWVSDLGQSSSFPPILGRWLKKARLCGSGSLVGRQSPSSGNPAGGTPASCPPGEAVSWAARWEPTQPSWREEVPLICGHLRGHCLSQLHACRRSGCPDVRPGAQEGKARSQSQDRMKIHCPPPPPGLPMREGNVCGEHRVFTGNGAITPGSGEAWAKARRPVAGWGGLPRALCCWGRDGSRAGRGTEMCAQVIDGRWASGSEEGWGRTAPLRPGGPPSIPVSGRGHRGSVVGTCQGWTHPSGSGSTSSSPG